MSNRPAGAPGGTVVRTQPNRPGLKLLQSWVQVAPPSSDSQSMPVPPDVDAANSTACSLGDSVTEHIPIGNEVVAGIATKVTAPSVDLRGPADVQISTITAPAFPNRAATLQTPGRPVPNEVRDHVAPPSRLTARPQSLPTKMLVPGPKKIWRP